VIGLFVTICDIAKKAKVSPSTVSRVIADSPRISEGDQRESPKDYERDELTSEHDRPVAGEPNHADHRGGVPGMAEQSLQHPFFRKLLGGIASMANKQAYKILLANVSTVDEERKMVKELTFGGIDY